MIQRARRSPARRIRRFARLSRLVVGLGLLALGACAGEAPAADYVVLEDVEPLRRAFQADTGAVRAIFLAAPT